MSKQIPNTPEVDKPKINKMYSMPKQSKIRNTPEAHKSKIRNTPEAHKSKIQIK